MLIKITLIRMVKLTLNESRNNVNGQYWISDAI